MSLLFQRQQQLVLRRKAPELLDPISAYHRVSITAPWGFSECSCRMQKGSSQNQVQADWCANKLFKSSSLLFAYPWQLQQCNDETVSLLSYATRATELLQYATTKDWLLELILTHTTRADQLST